MKSLSIGIELWKKFLFLKCGEKKEETEKES